MTASEIFNCDGCGRDTKAKSRLCPRCGVNGPANNFTGMLDRKSPSVEESRRNMIKRLAENSEESGWAYDDLDD